MVDVVHGWDGVYKATVLFDDMARIICGDVQCIFGLLLLWSQACGPRCLPQVKCQ